MYTALPVWRERLKAYLKEHGAVSTICVIPWCLETKFGLRYGWQVVRGIVSLSDGEPVYAEQKAGAVRRAYYRAQHDLERIADKERRVVFHWVPGELTAEACEELLARLADYTGQYELWLQ